MGLTNLAITAAIVGGVFLMMRTDIRQSTSLLRRNVNQIRTWLEEEAGSAAGKAIGPHSSSKSSSSPPPPPPPPSSSSSSSSSAAGSSPAPKPDVMNDGGHKQEPPSTHRHTE